MEGKSAKRWQISLLIAALYALTGGSCGTTPPGDNPAPPSEGPQFPLGFAIVYVDTVAVYDRQSPVDTLVDDTVVFSLPDSLSGKTLDYALRAEDDLATDPFYIDPNGSAADLYNEADSLVLENIPANGMEVVLPLRISGDGSSASNPKRGYDFHPGQHYSLWAKDPNNITRQTVIARVLNYKPLWTEFDWYIDMALHVDTFKNGFHYANRTLFGKPAALTLVSQVTA